MHASQLAKNAVSHSTGPNTFWLPFPNLLWSLLYTRKIMLL